jgi:hypothetical protein
MKFHTDGYLVVPDVVPIALTQQVIDAILTFSQIDLEDQLTWYQSSFDGHGIVPLHHHQALWDVRQHPAVHAVYADLYDDQELWVSMDRASYKPPAHLAGSQTRSWRRQAVHWDCDPWSFTGTSIQGLVYLTDTRINQGPFACIPSVYRQLDDYLDKHRDDASRLRPKLADQLTGIAGTAGSLVAFNRRMPHTSLLNESHEHRFVQYLNMELVGDEQQRLKRIDEWQSKMPPAWAIEQKVPHQQLPEPGGPAQLSALGRKLVGVDMWA